MKSKEVEVEVNGKATKVLLRNLLAGERNNCVRKAMKVNAMAQPPTSELDFTTFNELRLEYAVVEPRDLKVEVRDVRDANKVTDSAVLGSSKGIKLLEAATFDKLIATLDDIDAVNPLGKENSEKQ